MIRFIINSETPAKKNSRIVLRNGRNIPSKKYQEWHKDATEQIHRQAELQSAELFPMVPITEEISVVLTFYHGDQRRRDSDNGTSSILDLLTDCGIIIDDKWQIVREIKVRNYYEKNEARCVIEIEKFKEL